MRINFSIDLENNEVFDQEVQKALKAEAKRIAREQFSLVMAEEVKRIAGARAEEVCKGNTYSGIIREIRADVNAAVTDHLKRNEFSPAYIQKKTDEMFRKAQLYIDHHMDEIDDKLDAKISKMVKERLDKALADSLVRQIMRNIGGEADG